MFDFQNGNNDEKTLDSWALNFIWNENTLRGGRTKRKMFFEVLEYSKSERFDWNKTKTQSGCNFKSCNTSRIRHLHIKYSYFYSSTKASSAPEEFTSSRRGIRDDRPRNKQQKALHLNWGGRSDHWRTKYY